MSVDSLMLEKVEISGPPPPARLDHAMCTIYLPISPTTTTGDRTCRSKKSAADQGYHIEYTFIARVHKRGWPYIETRFQVNGAKCCLFQEVCPRSLE